MPAPGSTATAPGEALYLGSIVVTKTSPLDPLFDGLPVVIVEDLAELRDLSRLPAWLERFAPLAEPARVWRRLDAAAWVARIRTHLPREGS